MLPLVSILIPCHNAGAFLSETLRSALGQTWPSIEIIVVDDGSTDDTAAVLEPFVAQGVRALHQPNKGASAARNRALEAAHGDLIQFLDADDVLGPTKIAQQLETLQRRGMTKVASCAWGRFTSDCSDAVFTRERVWQDLSAMDFLVTCALEELMFPPAAWLVPRRLCDAAGPWDERLSMNDDGDYMARVLLASDGIVYCNGPRVYYRSGNPLSYGSRLSERAADSELRAWDSIVAAMMRVEASWRVERAAATGYQRIQARYFGRFARIVDQAERRERSFGRGEYRFGGGPAFRALVALIGWKNAMRLRIATTAMGRRAAR